MQGQQLRLTPERTTMNLHALMLRVDEGAPGNTIRSLLKGVGIEAHFQPIVHLTNGEVLGYESLVRGAKATRLKTPDELFRAMADAGHTIEFEETCLRTGVLGWSRLGTPGRLFLNLSAMALMDVMERVPMGSVMQYFQDMGVAPQAIIIEVTEHDRVSDLRRFLHAAKHLREHGVRFALDDFGDGRSSLRLWAELRPEIVKIDKYFIKNIHEEAVKVQTLRGLMHFAQLFATKLVAEGIETADELKVLKDLGVDYGQGYFLGRPASTPATHISHEALSVIRVSEIAILPEMSRVAGCEFTMDRLVETAVTVSPDTPVDELAGLFSRNEALRALAVVDNDKPVGLVNRQSFLNRYAKPYFREVFGRKSCLTVANMSPLMLDRNTGLDGATQVLTSADQHYLTEGFIVTDGGRYLGLATGTQLVRAVTESRIESARHANPLTFLPGNIPISENIARLLQTGNEFVACYGDLNDFKPYNDQYGYWRGDEMIRLVAGTFVAHCDPRRDFVGHVGGDDFVVLFQSSDWMTRCEQVLEVFNRKALDLYDQDALERGGIDAEDRYGIRRFFAFTTLVIGAVRIRPGRFTQPEQVASAAAAAKFKAKHSAVPLVVDIP